MASVFWVRYRCHPPEAVLSIRTAHGQTLCGRITGLWTDHGGRITGPSIVDKRFRGWQGHKSGWPPTFASDMCTKLTSSCRTARLVSYCTALWRSNTCWATQNAGAMETMPTADDDRPKNASASQTAQRPDRIVTRIVHFACGTLLVGLGAHPVCTQSVLLKGRSQAPANGILITGAGAVAIGIAIIGVGIVLMAHALFPTHRVWNCNIRKSGSSDNNHVR